MLTYRVRGTPMRSRRFRCSPAVTGLQHITQPPTSGVFNAPLKLQGSSAPAMMDGRTTLAFASHQLRSGWLTPHLHAPLHAAAAGVTAQACTRPPRGRGRRLARRGLFRGGPARPRAPAGRRRRLPGARQLPAGPRAPRSPPARASCGAGSARPSPPRTAPARLRMHQKLRAWCDGACAQDERRMSLAQPGLRESYSKFHAEPNRYETGEHIRQR